ncbi:hypothetical protein EJ08DRAFT_688584 [Tothia fuscella]|uniref:Small ribosomal subunit protein uS5m n=1 Tax=Tothia fuscella TaxID=1048955 RepID=A0A9P4NNM2_9PEZI|nr:hypothetical protein EJ08DRAFT_688584 [Tothia fuscella]
MSVCRPATCLFRRNASAIRSSSTTPTTIRPISTTSIRHGRRRPNYENLSRTELAEIDAATKHFPEYTPEERRALKHHYTPEQIAALEEAEKAIDLRDLVLQGQFRHDHWKPSYLDDFTTLDPFLDKKEVIEPTLAPRIRPVHQDLVTDEGARQTLEEEESHGIDDDPRSTDELFALAEAEEQSTQIRKFFAELKRYKGTAREHGIRVLLRKYAGDYEPPKYDIDAELRDPLTLVHGQGKELGLDPAYSALAPEVPKFDDPRIRWPFGDDDDPNAAGYKRLALQTGFTLDQIKKFRTKRLVTHRVVNQTRMGKIASMYNLTIAGNGQGLLGIGEGKSAEPEDAARQSLLNAIRNMKPIHRYEGRTIYGEVDGKVGAVQVKLSARPPGFGLRVHHLMYEMCRCAGIADLSARSIRSRNPMNTIKATFEALTAQKLPEDIARARGRKLIDLRKVYYAGKVY